MNMMYGIFLPILCCGMCVSPGGMDSKNMLESKAHFVKLEAELELDAVGQATGVVRLSLRNTSVQTLLVDIPNCLGVNIWPVMRDSTGGILPMQFRERQYCAGATTEIQSGNVFEIDFMYSIFDCFEMSAGDIYDLYFEYRGKIYDTDHQEIADDTFLLSNTLQVQRVRE